MAGGDGATSTTGGSDGDAGGTKSLAALPQNPDQKTLVDNFDYYCLLWKIDPTPRLWAQIPGGTPVKFCEKLPGIAGAFAGSVAGGLVLGRYRLGVHPVFAVPMWTTSAGFFFVISDCVIGRSRDKTDFLNYVATGSLAHLVRNVVKRRSPIGAFSNTLAISALIIMYDIMDGRVWDITCERTRAVMVAQHEIRLRESGLWSKDREERMKITKLLGREPVTEMEG